MRLRAYKQETGYTCGAAAMRIVLESLGIRKSEKLVARRLGTSKTKGTWNRAFPRLAEQYRLNYAVKRDASISDLAHYARNGFGIIVGHYSPSLKYSHYSVLKRISPKSVVLLDPYIGLEVEYSADEFSRMWARKSMHDREKNWFFAVKK